ncbi:MAG: GNAT family N-acetyltransferase [Alphaproteobacteria bacterium]|nr:GNAT family N-acetyltransferase [Alphaproteobacteria bacterium]
MSEIIIRKAELQDLETVQRLQANAGLFLTADGKSVFSLQELQVYSEQGYLLVAELNGIVVGYNLGERLLDGGVMLWQCAVEDKYRGQGIGKKLLEEFEIFVKKNGASWIFAYSELNEATLGFYKKNGFIFGKDYKEIIKLLR